MTYPPMFALVLVLGTSFQASAHCRTYQAPADSEFAGQRITVNETHIDIEEPASSESGFYGLYVEGLIRLRCPENKYWLPMCYGIVDVGTVHMTITYITDSNINFNFGGPSESWPAACQ